MDTNSIHPILKRETCFFKTVYRHRNHHKREVMGAWFRNYFAAAAETGMQASMMAQNILLKVDHRQSL